jgi:hypothetical protein
MMFNYGNNLHITFELSVIISKRQLITIKKNHIKCLLKES